jgi:hypothetical protein
MSKINVRSFSNENEDGAPDLVGITTFSATSYFVPTRGTTAQRPSDHVEVGSLRYNYDIKNLEYYRGHTLGWSQFELIDPDLGGGTGSNTGLGVRGVVPGGNSSPDTTSESISYITISTLGNSQDFGDLTVGINANTGGASRTRGLSLGGSFIPARQSTIEYFTFSSLGSAADYGDLSVARAELGCVTNQVRAVCGGGSAAPGDSDVMDYGTIASTGTFVDFGNLVDDRESVGGGISNGTRGIFYGGTSPAQNTIEYITIMTTGNTTDFGDLFDTEIRKQGCSNSTRGLIAGGNSPTTRKRIEYLTTATLGNAVDFGELTVARRNVGAVASPTRAVFIGGEAGAPSPAKYNTIDYVQIASTGDSVDFGDMDTAGATDGVIVPAGNASSNGHGGL